MNQAIYTEWTNQKQQRQHKGLLETLSDAEEERGFTNNANFHISGDCMERESALSKEVLRYLDFANRLVFDLEAQKGLARDVHDDV